MSVKKSQMRAVDRYNARHTVPVLVRFNKRTEPELVDKITAVPNKSGYIKTLIKNDIKNGRPE